jgi:hypothetical protein
MRMNGVIMFRVIDRMVKPYAEREGYSLGARAGAGIGHPDGRIGLRHACADANSRELPA